jgi:1-phosphofructokinase
MVAGFLAGWLLHHSYASAFRMGVAAGSATAFSEGLAVKKNILQLYERL